MLGQWRYPSGTDRARLADPSASLPGARSIICTATSYLTDDKPHDPYAHRALRGAVSAPLVGTRLPPRHRRQAARARAVDRVRVRQRQMHCVRRYRSAHRSRRRGPRRHRLVRQERECPDARIRLVGPARRGDHHARIAARCAACQELRRVRDLHRPLPDGCHRGRRRDRRPTLHFRLDAAERADSDRIAAPPIGNRIWGCDDCQSVCPVNERKERDAAVASTAFAPLPEIGTSVDLPAVLRMTKGAGYRRWFKPTSMAWRGKAVLQRNAAVALGNSRDKGAVPPLIDALRDRKPLVRGHAAWALGELGALSGSEGVAALEGLRATEAVEWVRAEADLALKPDWTAIQLPAMTPAREVYSAIATFSSAALARKATVAVLTGLIRRARNRNRTRLDHRKFFRTMPDRTRRRAPIERRGFASDAERALRGEPRIRSCGKRDDAPSAQSSMHPCSATTDRQLAPLNGSFAQAASVGVKRAASISAARRACCPAGTAEPSDKSAQ